MAVEDLKEPLEIPREALIATLQENLDKERAEREAESERERAAMNDFRDYMREHEEEVLGYMAFRLGFTSWGQSLKDLKDVFEQSDWKPRALQPTRKENDLEKLVRTLTLASNKTIQVTADQDIYRLL